MKAVGARRANSARVGDLQEGRWQLLVGMDSWNADSKEVEKLDAIVACSLKKDQIATRQTLWQPLMK